jgi:hypothetical protein
VRRSVHLGLGGDHGNGFSVSQETFNALLIQQTTSEFGRSMARPKAMKGSLSTVPAILSESSPEVMPDNGDSFRPHFFKTSVRVMQ